MIYTLITKKKSPGSESMKGIMKQIEEHSSIPPLIGVGSVARVRGIPAVGKYKPSYCH